MPSFSSLVDSLRGSYFYLLLFFWHFTLCCGGLSSSLRVLTCVFYVSAESVRYCLASSAKVPQTKAPRVSHLD
jgi:hypothetical protein